MKKYWRLVWVLMAAMGFAGCDSSGGDDAGNWGGAFQGAYSGTFSGTEEGSWRFSVNAVGDLTGAVYSTSENRNYTLEGSVDASGDLQMGLYNGSQNNGTYSGTINASGEVTGTWNSADSVNSGNFTGKRF